MLPSAWCGCVLRKICQDAIWVFLKLRCFFFFKLGSVEQTSERACCSTPQARVVLCGEADATLKSLLVVLVGDVKKHA